MGAIVCREAIPWDETKMSPFLSTTRCERRRDHVVCRYLCCHNHLEKRSTWRHQNCMLQLKANMECSYNISAPSAPIPLALSGVCCSLPDTHHRWNNWACMTMSLLKAMLVILCFFNSNISSFSDSGQWLQGEA